MHPGVQAGSLGPDLGAIAGRSGALGLWADLLQMSWEDGVGLGTRTMVAEDK